MKDRSIFRVGLLASTMLASASLSAMAGEVTTPRLLDADKEPQNWLQVNKDYAAHRYSELDQINKNNVKDLHVAFTVALGGAQGGKKLRAITRARRSSTMAPCTSSTAGARSTG